MSRKSGRVPYYSGGPRPPRVSRSDSGSPPVSVSGDGMNIPQALKRILAKVDDDVREEQEKKTMSVHAIHEEIERIIQYIETAREGVVVPSQSPEMDGEPRGSQGSGQEDFSGMSDESGTMRFIHFRDKVMQMIFRNARIHELFSARDSPSLEDLGHYIVIFAGLLLVNTGRTQLTQQKLLNDLGRKVHAWAVDGQPRPEQTGSD